MFLQHHEVAEIFGDIHPFVSEYWSLLPCGNLFREPPKPSYAAGNDGQERFPHQNSLACGRHHSIGSLLTTGMLNTAILSVSLLLFFRCKIAVLVKFGFSTHFANKIQQVRLFSHPATFTHCEIDMKQLFSSALLVAGLFALGGQVTADDPTLPGVPTPAVESTPMLPIPADPGPVDHSYANDPALNSPYVDQGQPAYDLMESSYDAHPSMYDAPAYESEMAPPMQYAAPVACDCSNGAAMSGNNIGYPLGGQSMGYTHAGTTLPPTAADIPGGMPYNGAYGGGSHVRHPFYSYRAPWYYRGPASNNVTIVW